MEIPLFLSLHTSKSAACILESVFLGISHEGGLAGPYGNDEGRAHTEGKRNTEDSR